MPEIVITSIITSTIAAIVGALVGAIVSKAKTINREAADFHEMQKQTLIMTCRLTIYNEHFSVDEKLEAYKIYRAHGGNHQTKIYMDELVGSDVDEYIEKH